MSEKDHHVKWDETNLEYNEQNKCATMKIDEPPTPFNFEYCEDEVDEEHAAKASLSFADQWKREGMDEIINDPEKLKPSFEASEPTEEDLAEKKKKFEEIRKEHYRIKNPLANHVQFNEDNNEEHEVEDEKQEEEDAETKHELFVKKRKAFYAEQDREAAERAKAMEADGMASEDSEGND
ncbi:hypothetical protein GUITHDRAFT_110797 [Guillardia theta CCMP2712]|uniref:Protein phosphatase inhibitor 2 n=2 Tax=Guillardia theta TaxID=55529 RepID=L1J412_GUITC|nr:hypothetical protein GUITHDRAFT_110797 [Guillardia theta CCMP2712]EKX43072.1 hypothetical protein GUITHDRAFT_110797 [Guillardia theta CCMP2712]|mmetsp:Transcript_51036/g.159475  ORF Transcript_51036/g.159475 Transcript_51036/m.159475 type:complete len:180 (+) Transcript_51036:118-657(+)|eukprot:XP_005830052.1 hypothetical protein GUITHDRAFT_110797 [Guillardia theta CCMP2712]